MHSPYGEAMIRAALVRFGVLQLMLIACLWLAGQAIVSLTGLPLPGAVVGLFLTLALLATGVVSLPGLEKGSAWLLADMLVFFVPAVIALVDHHEFLGALGVKLLLVIAGSTVAVMLATAGTVELCARLRPAKEDAQ